MTRPFTRHVLTPLLTAAWVGLLAGALSAAPARAATGDGSPTDSNIRYVGRWDNTNASIARSYWSGAYFRVGFTGSTVQLRLAAAASFFVSIDGGPDRAFSGSGTLNLTPTPLAAGSHTLRVTARSENEVLQFQGLVLASGATTLAAPARPRRLEFIGDSITAGCCALPNYSVDDYAWLGGEALNADHTQVAFSGVCLQNGVACHQGMTVGMSSQYFKLQTVQYPSSPAWDFSRYQPDAVVINLGTNDNTFGVSDATYQSTYTTFLRDVRARYPNAFIFALRPFGGFKATPTFNAVYARVGAGDTKLYYVDTTGWVTTGTADYSDTLHPSTSGHVKIARLLAPHIAKTARWVPAFGDDFNDGNANGWSTYGGAWSGVNGQLSVAAHPGAKAVPSGALFANGTLDADITIGASGNAGLMFRASRLELGPDAYQGYFAGFEQGQVVLGRVDNGWTTLGAQAASLAANVAHHVRVVTVGPSLKVYVDDMNTPKISVTDATYTVGTVGVRTYQADARFDNVTTRAFSRFEASIQGYVVRHFNGRARIDTVPLPAEDAEWRIVPGLANASAVSLESVAFPGNYLRHRDGQVWLNPNDGTALFKADATWWRRPGQANSSLTSFESTNFPGSFIRHRDGLLFSEPLSTALDRSDATFRE